MMRKKKTVDEKICDALDLEYEQQQETQLTKPSSEELNIVVSDKSKDIEKDYTSVRKNLKEIINKGNGAIDGILAVASEGDSPRAYEVAAQMIKTVAEANKDLMELHKKVKEISKEEVNYNATTNNAIYVGSTKELQELVNQSRSASRRISSNDNIIDTKILEDGN